MFKQGAIGASLAAGLALCAGPVFARDDPSNTDGLYVGAAIGDFSSALDSPDDVDDVDLDFDDQDANRLYVGWRFNRFLAVQVDFTDFGESNAGPNALGITADSDGVSPTIVGTLPIGPVELFAKAGLIAYNLDVNSDTDNLIDDSGTDPVYGVGVGITVLKRLNLRAEYERVDIEQLDDANAVWISANWRF